MMPRSMCTVCLLSLLLSVSAIAQKKPAKTPEGQSIVIVLKNGRQETFAMSDVARIEFPNSPGAAESAAADTPGRGHFLGKWRLGEGNGQNFLVTLEANGDASKSIGGNPHGKWTVVNGEARISWDEGSWDAIRKVNGKYLKFWHPDGNFSGKPNNVDDAEHIESNPI